MPLSLAHQAIKSHSRTRRWLFRWSPKIRTCLRRLGPFAMRLQRSAARQSGRYELRSRTRRKSCCPTARPSDTGSPRHWAIASEPSRADWLTKTPPMRRSWTSCGEPRASIRQGAEPIGFADRVVARIRRVEFVQSRFRALDRPFAIRHAQREAASRAGLKPSSVQTCRAGLKRQTIGLRDQVRLFIRSYFGFTTQRLRRRGRSV